MSNWLFRSVLQNSGKINSVDNALSSYHNNCKTLGVEKEATYSEPEWALYWAPKLNSTFIIIIGVSPIPPSWTVDVQSYILILLYVVQSMSLNSLIQCNSSMHLVRLPSACYIMMQPAHVSSVLVWLMTNKVQDEPEYLFIKSVNIYCPRASNCVDQAGYLRK